MAEPPRGDDHSAKPSRLLAGTGLALLIIAAIGFLQDKSELLVGGFLIVGAGILLISVVVPRLEGAQELKLTGATINLVRATERAELELTANRVPSIEEVVEQLHEN